jgi:hypothetical protein
MKQCPFCAEDIKDKAVICPHCRKDLSASAALGRLGLNILILGLMIPFVAIGIIILMALFKK